MEKEESSWKEILRFAIIAFAIVIPIRVVVAEPFKVSGSSMVPSFQNGDYLIVDKLSYKLTDPERDDVVVFRYPNDPKKFFIKRIIGLPNETVDIRGREITITNEAHKEGFILIEPYIENAGNNTTHYELKDDEYFVMGDNRPASSDSRYWGPVKRDLISGRAFIRLYPFGDVDFKPGDYKQPE